MAEQVALGWLNPDGTPANPEIYLTPEQGAATSVWAATSPELDGRGGVYPESCAVAGTATDPLDFGAPGVAPFAVDPSEAARLWALSAALTGVDAF